MANPENLIPNDQRTPSQRRANASKAGKASAKARRERKAMRELAQIVLDTPMKAGKRDTINTIEDLKKEGGPNISVEEFALFNIARKAMSGDVSAMTFLRDTIGEKPTDCIEISSAVDEAEAEITSMIEAELSSRDKDDCS